MKLADAGVRLKPAHKQFLQWAANKYGRRRLWVWWFVRSRLSVDEAWKLADRVLQDPRPSTKGRKMAREVKYLIEVKVGAVSARSEQRFARMIKTARR